MRMPWIAWALAAAACGGDGSSGDGRDGAVGGAPDAARPDPGPPDAGPPDASPPDAEPPPLTVCPDGTALFATVQAAIDAAPAGARIVICPGTYAEHLVIAKPLRIEAESPHAVTIDGGGELLVPAIDVRVVPAAAGEVVVSGLVVRGGRPGVSCDGANLTLDRLLVTANRGTRGGGVSYLGCDGAIHASTITGNHAADGGGVAIVGGAAGIQGGELSANHAINSGGGLYLEGDGRIDGTLIAENTTDNKGGGVFVYQHAPVIANVVVRGNTAVADGGGMLLETSSAQVVDGVFEDNRSILDDAGALRLHSATARIERCRFASNRAAGDGGAIKVSHAESAFVDLVFEDNEAAGNGGAVELDDDNTVIERSMFRGNVAARGGGVHGQLMGFGGGVHDSWFEHNVATERGGALAFEQNEGFVALSRLTLVANQAVRGAGVSVQSTAFSFTNSLLVGGVASSSGGGVHAATAATGTMAFLVFDGNDAPVASAVRVADATVTLDSSILVHHAGDVVRVDAPVSWSWSDVWPAGGFDGMPDPTGASGNVSLDPMFAGGGYELGPASPLIDAGNPDVLDGDGSRADPGIHGGPDAP
jgi:predicted outer membrane repeat protein